jgi:glutaredoxin
MKLLRACAGIVLLCACFLVGVYGGPAARAAYAHVFPEPAFRTGDFSSLYRDAGSPVVLFSTSTCPYCKQTRELLQQRRVAYVDFVVDQSESAARRFKSVGGKGVPLIYVGDRSISGFREDAIVEALARLPPAHPSGT